MNTYYDRLKGTDISINEAAQILGTNLSTINNLINDGVLQAYQLTPRIVRICRESIISLKNTSSISPSKSRGEK